MSSDWYRRHLAEIAVAVGTIDQRCMCSCENSSYPFPIAAATPVGFLPIQSVLPGC